MSELFPGGEGSFAYAGFNLKRAGGTEGHAVFAQRAQLVLEV